MPILCLLATACLPLILPTTAPNDYADRRLCFALNIPSNWSVDGVSGGFVAVQSGDGSSFNVANVALEEVTLEQALNHLEQSHMAAQIEEVHSYTLDGEPAWRVSFASDAPYTHVVLVIAPDCGDGRHALFISAQGDNDDHVFEKFLDRIHFLP